MMNKKGATSIAILLLVLMTLVLSGAGLYSFYISDNKIEKTIADARFIEEVYVKEERARSLLKQIFEKAFEESYKEELTNPQNEVNLKGNFIEMLSEYKTNNEVINELKGKVNDFNIIFDGNKAILELKGFELRVTKQIKERKINWVWYIIPAGTIEKITEEIGVVYKVDIKIEILKENI